MKIEYMNELIRDNLSTICMNTWMTSFAILQVPLDIYEPFLNS